MSQTIRSIRPIRAGCGSGFIIYDGIKMAKEGATRENTAALGADVLAAVIPRVTGAGVGARAAVRAEEAMARAAARTERAAAQGLPRAFSGLPESKGDSHGRADLIHGAGWMEAGMDGQAVVDGFTVASAGRGRRGDELPGCGGAVRCGGRGPIRWGAGG